MKKDYKPIDLGFKPEYDAEDEKAFAQMSKEFVEALNKGDQEKGEKEEDEE